jgi:hypothetical protein
MLATRNQVRRGMAESAGQRLQLILVIDEAVLSHACLSYALRYAALAQPGVFAGGVIPAVIAH